MDCLDRRDAVICGIDPGLRVLGYAVVRSSGGHSQLLDAGVCRIDDALPLATRLVEIERDLLAVFQEHHPRVVAVESLYAHYRHPRTAILMGHARGVVLLTAARLGIELRDYSATRVKRHVTGNGQADKRQVQRAIQTVLQLSDPPAPSDLADAIAIAMCCAAEIERKSLVGVPG